MRYWGVVALLIAAPAFAGDADFKPTFETICKPAKIAPGTSGEIDRHKLVGQLLKTAGISDIDLDSEGNEVTFAMKRQAVVEPRQFCLAGRACSKDARENLGIAFSELNKFIAANNKPLGPDDSGFEILRMHGDPKVPISAAELMDNLFTGISARCVMARPKQVGAGNVGNRGAGQAKPGKKGESAPPMPVIMVRKKVDDFKYAQGTDGFKGLDRATFSLTSDYLKKSTTYNVDGVVGVGIANFELTPDVDSNLVGYGLYTRQFVAGQVPKNSKDVYNIGGGIAENFHVGSGAGAYILQFSSQYVQSEVSQGKLWSANLTYTPQTGPFIGRAEYIGPFAFVFSPQLKVSHGQVIDRGFDPTFVANKAFDQIGGHLDLLMVFDSPDPALAWLGGFSWRNSYDYYYGMTGFYRSIDRFESKISYKFPDQQLWSVDLDYISGRNLDTLEFQQQLTLGVGFKY